MSVEVYLESRNSQVYARTAQALREFGLVVLDARTPGVFAVLAPDPQAVALDLARGAFHFVILKPTTEAIIACDLSARGFYKAQGVAAPAEPAEAPAPVVEG